MNRGTTNSIDHFGSESTQATIKRFPCRLSVEGHARLHLKFQEKFSYMASHRHKLRMNNCQDRLEKIFDEQKKLVEYLGVDRYPKKTQERISALMTAIVHEAIELQDLTSWKWWKRSSRFEWEKAEIELIDILHFVIQAAIELEMTPQKMLEVYMNKNYINRKRRDRGY